MSSTHVLCANTIKALAMDAVQAANSGHPGMPMGMADVATVLWTRFLVHDPADPQWPDRDRFILSAGHGSMLLYSLLHLSGYELSLDELRHFRQLGSQTPGHPEYGHTVGVETTTGPLGQGFAMGVGFAVAERFLRESFGSELCDHHIYAIVSDGDLMEGISYEAASLAGHLGLGKLVYLYDDNAISIDGSTELAFTEDVTARFKAAGWQVLDVDGHDPDAIEAAIEAARAETARPSLVRCRTRIGKDSPLEGSEKSHGAALGVDNVAATKRALGLDPERHFDVPTAARAAFRAHDGPGRREAWLERHHAHPRAAEFDAWLSVDLDAVDVAWPTFEVGAKLATRKASAAVLKAIAAAAPWLLGGSADLSGSNGVAIGAPSLAPGGFAGGHSIHFGVREHAMAAIANGMSLHGGVRPYVATFLVFHDYHRPSVRLSCLMNQPVLYIYTHDSIFLGEDGPTHQPIETLLALRALPNLHVFRPADAHETLAAWQLALQRTDGPTALVLTRQGLPILPPVDVDTVATGAVVRRDTEGNPDAVLLATGSEVALALEAAEQLAGEGYDTRVVSLPCVERFLEQDVASQDRLLPPDVPRVAIEAGATHGWWRLVGLDGAVVGIDTFGASAPAGDLAKHFGFTPERVSQVVRDCVSR